MKPNPPANVALPNGAAAAVAVGAAVGVATGAVLGFGVGAETRLAGKSVDGELPPPPHPARSRRQALRQAEKVVVD